MPEGSVSGPVDVVVVGGGVTGCSCALTLARGGKRVRLVEAREIAGGASGRNGGFALRGLALGYDIARETLGPESARTSWELTERGLDAMEALAGDAFRRVGSLRLAGDPAERDELRREYEALRGDGFEAEWLDPFPEPLRALFAGGFVHPGDGALDPARWVRRLAARAAAAGVQIVEGHPVDREAVDALDADAVVLAVDGLTDTLAPELSPWVAPMRGQVLASDPLPERIYERPHYSRGGYDYFGSSSPSGTLILGGRRDTSLQTEQTAEEETTPFIQAQLESFAAELNGRPVPIARRWAGIWGETFDLLTFAGRRPGTDRLWGSGGYFRGARQRARLRLRRSRCKGHPRRAGPGARALRSGSRLRVVGRTRRRLDSHARRAGVRPGGPRPGTTTIEGPGGGAVAPRLERDRAHLDLSCALDAGDRDRQVLNRETRRVEDGDLVPGLPPRRLPGEHSTDLSHIFTPDQAGLDRVGDVSRMAGLLPIVAKQAHARVLLRAAAGCMRSARELCGGDLRLPGAVGAHQAHVLPGREGAVLEEHGVPGSHRDHDVRPERFLE